MADSMPSRRRSPWLRFLLIWASVLLVLGAIGCFVLYRYFSIYEITRPEPVVEEYLAQSTAEELIRLAKANVTLELTEFEAADALYDSYLQTVDANRKLTYRSDGKRSDSDRLVYIVYSGPNAICSISLTPDGSKPGFGRHVWKVSEISSAPITDLLPSTNVVVDATAGTSLNLNGKQISDSYIIEKNIPIPDLSRFESAIDPAPTFVRYQVGPLYGEIELTDSFGRTLSPDSNSASGMLHYQASSGSQQLVIRAPSDLKVSINGIELGTLDISSSEPGILEGLDAYTKDGAVLTNTYRFEGLYLKPEVTAVDANGNSLSPVITSDNSIVFFHQNDPTAEEELLPYAEKFFNAYMEYSAHSWEASRFYNLLSCILPGTSLYNYVMNSTEAMYWASGTSTAYKDLRYDHFHKVSDTCYTCTVLYSADMTATTWHEQYNYSLENAYELVFVSTMGNWFAASMNVISGL